MATAQAPAARAWNPDFNHSDRERWICIYPLYINSKRTIAEGRKVSRNKGVDNPTYAEIRDVCASAGLIVGVENKVHPKESDPRDARFRGRIRIQIKNEDGSLMLEQFPTRKSVLEFLGETIPKLKSRQAGQGGSQPSQQATQASSGGGKKKKGKKK